MKSSIRKVFALCALLNVLTAMNNLNSQAIRSDPHLDEKVSKFLNDHSGMWHDLNVPKADGQLLYDLIIRNNYKSALEIGTSTGYSGIWIAWALRKTGGKLITIEIDEERYKIALQNFKEAGLSDYIDARLGDAHKIVRELKGPFDFVFSDADKEWYKNYFLDVDPKLTVGGCFTAHNISEKSDRTFGSYDGQAIFYDYIKSLKNYQTTLNKNGAGMSISFKKAEK